MTDDDKSTAASTEPPIRPGNEPGPSERTVIDAVADLLQTIVDWLRQEAEAAVREKVVFPLQRLGFTLFFALAASGLIMAGILMLSIASLLLLAQWLTWPGALALIGTVMAIGSAVALAMRQKMVQK